MKKLAPKKTLFIPLLVLLAFSNCHEKETNNLVEPDDEVEVNSVPSIVEGSIQHLTVNDFQLPPQDANGFTILTASDDSQIIYVDNAKGNDATGIVYSTTDNGLNGDPFNPPSTIKPFATIAAASKHTRHNKPDIMLLVAGGVWYETLNTKNGKSNTERSIYASYGTGDRPELRTGANKAINSGPHSNIIISGIKFWAHTRDDKSSFYEGTEGVVGFNFYAHPRIPFENALIEDCYFRKYVSNVITNKIDGGQIPMKRMVLRRNIFYGNYSETDHSQGLYYTGQGNTDNISLLLEENFFDHNGWRIQSTDPEGRNRENGQATVYNHNIYFGNAKGVLFKGNIFSRASSIGTKWTANHGPGSSANVAIIDNLYVDGEIGMSIGGNDPGELRFKNFVVKENVLTNLGRSKPTSRELAWYIEITDWDNGECINNLLLHKSKNVTGNFKALQIHSGNSTKTQDLLIGGNIIYGMNGNLNKEKNGLVQISNVGSLANVQFNNNSIYTKSDINLMIKAGVPNVTFSGNHYYTPYRNWFRNSKSETNIPFDVWVNNQEGNAKILDISQWENPERDVVGYMKFIGKGATIDDFIQEMLKQSKTNWDSRLTASSINNWIREGFNR